jgi:hypothetical protein
MIIGLLIEMEATFKPDALDRRILVHFKYYPDLASVPERVSDSKMGQVLFSPHLHAYVCLTDEFNWP